MIQIHDPVRSLQACHCILLRGLLRKSRLDHLQELLEGDVGLPRRNLSLGFFIDFVVLGQEALGEAYHCTFS